MQTKVYWIHRFDNAAQLGTMAKPQGGEWLEYEIKNLQKQKVGVVVSLLKADEIQELGLTQEQQTCESFGIRYLNFPITDRSIPTAKDKVNNLVAQLMNYLNSGISVVIHCRMGIGRSSIIAASVLLKNGFKADDIIRNISKVRGLQVPDTEQQLKWLRARQ